MTPRLGWLPWAPHLLALAVLLALALNTNLGRPWRGLTPSDDDAIAVAVIFLVGAIPWYTAFLLVLRHPALALVGAAPPARAGVAAIATAALVAALGLTKRGGGLIAFNLQDLLVALPGVTAVAFADGLDVRGLAGDPARVDPRRWAGRNVAGERRRVRWASLLPDGRLLLQVGVTWERGVFGEGGAEALLALRPDGALDERFAGTLGRSLEGAPLVAGDRVIVAEGASPPVLGVADGAPAAAAGARLAAALAAAGAAESAPGPQPGTLVARRPGARGEVTLLDVSGAEPRVLGRALPAQGRAPAWWSAVADGGGVLLRSDTSVLVNAPGPSGGPPGDPAPLVEELVRRYRADGARDPAFRFRLPPGVARALGLTNLAVRHLVRLDGRTLVLLHGEGDVLAAVGPDGAVEPGSWLWIRGEPGEGYVADVAPLDDGRVALVFSERHDQTRVAIVAPGRAGELPGLELAEVPAPAPSVSAGAAGSELVVPGEVLAVTGRGEVIVRGPAGLRIVDAASGAERALRSPPWLETP